MPGILVGLGKAPVVLKSPRATFILTNFTSKLLLANHFMIMVGVCSELELTSRFSARKLVDWQYPHDSHSLQIYQNTATPICPR